MKNPVAVGSCIAAIVVISGIAFHSIYARRVLERQYDELRAEFELAKILAQLKVPSDVIYSAGSRAGREAYKLLARDFLFHGVESFLPYASVRKLSTDSTMSLGEEVFFARRPLTPLDLANDSPSSSWLNRVDETWSQLVVQTRPDSSLGRYMATHPNTYTERLRPWIARLTEFRHPFPRMYACLMMLEMEERSADLLKIVELTIREEPHLASAVHRYDLDMQVPTDRPSPEERTKLWATVRRHSRALQGAIGRCPVRTIRSDAELREKYRSWLASLEEERAEI